MFSRIQASDISGKMRLAISLASFTDADGSNEQITRMQVDWTTLLQIMVKWMLEPQ